MFDNIGSKIKGLATFTTFIGIFFSVIIGITTMTDNVGAGLIILIGGSVGSWIGSLTLYGFGELVVCAQIIAQKMTENPGPANYGVPQAPQPASPAPQNAPWPNSPAYFAGSVQNPISVPAPEDPFWVCRECGTSNLQRVRSCQGCGVSRQWSDAQSTK